MTTTTPDCEVEALTKHIPLELIDQHDCMGNARHLRSERTRMALDHGDWHRASHLCECRCCGRPYADHEQVLGTLWLNRLCDGTLVKL